MDDIFLIGNNSVRKSINPEDVGDKKADADRVVKLWLNLRKQLCVASLSATRNVFDFSCYDFSLLQRIPTMAPMFSDVRRLLLILLGVVRLFLAVGTLMIVSSDITDKAGVLVYLDLTDAERMGAALRYGAVPFLFLYQLQLNNFFAEKMYYLYMQCGALIDFPETKSIRFYLNHRLPMLFILYYLLYVVYGIITLFFLQASIGQCIIFTNCLIHILIYWVRQQGIESTLCSLTSFIESFPDSSNAYMNIDDKSLTRASQVIRHMTLLETASPSYSGYMRHEFLKIMALPGKIRWLIRIVFHGSFLAATATVIVYSYFQLDRKKQNMWEDQISPCVDACTFDFGAGVHNGSNCRVCLCRCLMLLGKEINKCVKYLSVPNCSNDFACHC